MASIDAGIFVIMLGIAFGTLFMSRIIPYGYVFKLVGAFLFLALAVVMNAEYDVVYATTSVGDVNATETQYIIGDGDPATNNNHNWIGWLFLGLGLAWIGLFFVELFNV